MPPIPKSMTDITADWLTAALRAGGAISCRVVRAETAPMSESVGLLSSMFRSRLWYDAQTGGEPSSVVIKMEPDRQQYRAYVEGVHGFEREIRFYREIGPTAPLRTPRFFYGDFDVHRAVIILEDLEHLQSRDQIVGLRNEEAAAAVRQIARLQARYWDNDALTSLHWIPMHERRLTAHYDEYWPAFEEAFGKRIGQEAVALGRRLRGKSAWLHAELAARPCTLCHSDFRADNLLFGGIADEVVVIDWQIVIRSLGAMDVARLVGGSEPASERTAHPMDVLSAWYETLCGEGVRDYGFDAALDDLRLGILINLGIPLRLSMMVGLEPRRRERRLLEAITTRMFACALEVDAASRLPKER